MNAQRLFLSTKNRRGTASVLAMLFLILFSALVLGFYASTTTSVQLSRNDQASFASQLAAESGTQFLRYVLSRVSIPPGTTADNIAGELYIDLKAQLEGTSNLGAQLLSRNGNTITIPSINLGGRSSFAASVAWNAPKLSVTVTGVYGGGSSALSRIVRTDFAMTQVPSTVFSYGVAAKGKVQVKVSGTTQILGTPDSAASVLSAYAGAPAITTGNGPIEGDLAVIGTKSQVSLGSGSVGGSTIASVIMSDHVSVVPPPEFPTVNTDVFKPYAVNTYTAGGPYKNIRIPANTNPRFNGGDVIQGIMYIESPNTVTFRGNATVNGVIVFENKGDPLVNVLDFKGNVTPSLMPNTSEFAGIRSAVNGLAIAAPTASVTMSGSVDGTLEGSLIAYEIALSGSADLLVKKGSLVSVGPTTTEISTDIGGKKVTFEGTASDAPPTTGVTFSGNFKPDPRTYRELMN